MTWQPQIKPNYTEPVPRGLTLEQFIQQLLVGITGIEGSFVRPIWQIEEPNQPTIDKNWISYGIISSQPDANAWVATKETEDEEVVVESQRHELLNISLNIYGPLAFETAGIIRDGFQIPTNLQALVYAKMGFVEVGTAQRSPDLMGGRWVQRFNMSLFLRRQIVRTYPIPTLISAGGTIYSNTGNQTEETAWETPPGE